jgi:hypothetical protein
LLAAPTRCVERSAGSFGACALLVGFRGGRSFAQCLVEPPDRREACARVLCDGWPRQGSGPPPPPIDPNCGNRGAQGAALVISSPAHRITYSAAQCSTESPFTTVTDADSRIACWLVDSAMAGTAGSRESLSWRAHSGIYIFRAIDGHERAAAEEITVSCALKRSRSLT